MGLQSGQPFEPALHQSHRTRVKFANPSSRFHLDFVQISRQHCIDLFRGFRGYTLRAKNKNKDFPLGDEFGRRFALGYQREDNKEKKESFSFIIQGHVCCTEGDLDAIDRRTKERNLSVARAEYVYNYFIEKGIDKNRMSYEGLAHRFPLGGSEDKDRRVEIVISSN